MESKTEKLWQKYGYPEQENIESAPRIPAVRICPTTSCNFRCYYCTPCGESYCGENAKNKQAVITEKNLCTLLIALSETGFSEIRWSGGEPLLVADMLFSVMKKMKKQQPDLNFGMTTNGFFLKKYAKHIADSNLSELIVSLDSLNRNRFKEISGVDGLKQVTKGIKVIKEHTPIRLNVILTRRNFGERWHFIDFAIDQGINLKFLDLDYFVNPGAGIWDREFVPLTGFVNEAKQKFKKYEEIWRVGHTGIPMTKIQANSTTILFKDSTRGTHYTPGCEKCPLHPAQARKHHCQEGLYEMFITSDGRCSICKHRSDKGVDLKKFGFDKPTKIEPSLHKMLKYYAFIKFRPKANKGEWEAK